jgi:hypothetical protein
VNVFLERIGVMAIHARNAMTATVTDAQNGRIGKHVSSDAPQERVKQTLARESAAQIPVVELIRNYIPAPAAEEHASTPHTIAIIRTTMVLGNITVQVTIDDDIKNTIITTVLAEIALTHIVGLMTN